ncbi:hypothetical protein B0H66DRAFT_298763 [Apodospora peruviana]|uniref:CorA-like transporter domain-containing protein n=1 Tax=Apodospora peruviana TaxID=516989 RepID=A0AAE0I1I5_9PEZI|nr:hypothetical protein B0H66DRAFT_298763 [Apodospora peruviana]
MSSPLDGNSEANTAEFTRSCKESADYPLNVVRTDVFGHSLKSLQTILKDGRLFDQEFRSLYIRDLHQDKNAFEPAHRLDSVEDLANTLNKTEKDPWWRLVFLHSQSSRKPLGCSREQLTLLLTHHQVMPSFVELVATFKRRSDPLAYTIFRYENYLDASSPSFQLPSLGRSGVQVQHAFNLLSVEKTHIPEERNQWPLRHATMCHSFDVQTGRSLIILLKGNRELTTRMIQAPERNRRLRPDAPRTREASFMASLQSHLIMLEWCVESWGAYINDMEETLSNKSVEAKVAPVADITSPVPLAETFVRRSTLQSMGSRRGTFQRQDSAILTPASPVHESAPPPPPPTSPRRIGSRTLSGFLRRNSSGLARRGSDLSQGGSSSNALGEDPGADRLQELEERFSFGELQRLSLTGDEIDRSIVAIEQNKDVVEQIKEQYETVTTSHAFTSLMKQDEVSGDVRLFFRRVRSIERDLDVHRHRLLALSRSIDNDKQIFESLNQHTSIQSSKAFSLLAQTSTQEMMKWTAKMHNIAVKTKQETLSMHVITVFTLIFLPGTFIAVRIFLHHHHRHYDTSSLTVSSLESQTFFSSGVLNWNDEGLLDSDWVVRGSAVRLFMSICLPMMAIIIAGWAAMYMVARQRARRHRLALGLPADEEEGYYVDEKGATATSPTSPSPTAPGSAQQQQQRGLLLEPAPIKETSAGGGGSDGGATGLGIIVQGR